MPATTLTTMNEKSPIVYAGVDVAKATFQLHFQGRQCCLDNTPKGCAQLLQLVQASSRVQIICEATGGYEKDLLTACHAAGQAVSRLNPALVRHFARAQGQRAKNDPLDAAVLTANGTALQPEPTLPTDNALENLRDLVQWRDHLQEQLTRARQTISGVQSTAIPVSYCIHASP